MRKEIIFLVFVFAVTVFLFNQRIVLAQEGSDPEGSSCVGYGILRRIPEEILIVVGALAAMSLSSYCIALNLAYKIHSARKTLIKNHFEKLAKRNRAAPNRPSPVSMADNSPEIRN